MAQPDNLEARVASLETQVHELSGRVYRTQQDAAAARVLAGCADRDVDEVRKEVREFREQNNRMLNAMREDISDLSHRVDNLDRKVDSGFAATATSMNQIAMLLNTVIAQQGRDQHDESGADQ